MRLLLRGFSLAFAVPLDAEARLRQADAVASAAAAVAHARASGARPRDIALLMATYRQAAESLAALDRPNLGELLAREEQERRAARAALAEAIASGRAAPDARALLTTWLGPLDVRLGLLEQVPLAAAAVRVPELSRSLRLDAEDQCLALMEAAAYDATFAEADAAAARLRASALRADDGPHEGPSLQDEGEVRELEAAATLELAFAQAAWALRDRAAIERAGLERELSGGGP